MGTVAPRFGAVYRKTCEEEKFSFFGSFNVNRIRPSSSPASTILRSSSQPNYRDFGASAFAKGSAEKSDGFSHGSEG
jgi:hypothetical protein